MNLKGQLCLEHSDVTLKVLQLGRKFDEQLYWVIHRVDFVRIRLVNYEK